MLAIFPTIFYPTLCTLENDRTFSVFRELTLIITTLFFRVHVLQKEIHVAKVVFGLMNLLSSIRTKFIQNTLFSTQKYYYYFWRSLSHLCYKICYLIIRSTCLNWNNCPRVLLSPLQIPVQISCLRTKLLKLPIEFITQGLYEKIIIPNSLKRIRNMWDFF